MFNKNLPITLLLMMGFLVSPVFSEKWEPMTPQEMEANIRSSTKPEWEKYRDLGLYHFNSGQYYQAEHEIQTAIEEAEKAGKLEQMGGLFHLLGGAYRGQQKFEGAVVQFQKAIDWEKKNNKKDPAIVIASLNNMGDTYRVNKEFDKALSALLEAKRMAMPDNPLYATIFHNLGMAYAGRGNFTEAEQSFLSSIRIDEQAVPPRPEATLESRYSLTLLYHKEKKYKEALATAEKGLAISQKFRSKKAQSFQIAVTGLRQATRTTAVGMTPTLKEEWEKWMSIGHQANQNKTFLQAAEAFEKAAAIIEKTGVDDQGSAFLNLGTIYLELREFKKAEEALTKALPGIEKHFPKDSPTAKAHSLFLEYAKQKNTEPVMD